MSLRTQEDIAAASLRYLVSQRRRLGLWLSGPSTRNTSTAQSLSERLGLRYIDLLGELATKLTDDPMKPIGVFAPDDLIEWIQQQSYIPNSPPIIIDEIEPVLATFTKLRVVGFFRFAARLDPRVPVVLISHLDDLVSAAAFPHDRIWRLEVK